MDSVKTPLSVQYELFSKTEICMSHITYLSIQLSGCDFHSIIPVLFFFCFPIKIRSYHNFSYQQYSCYISYRVRVGVKEASLCPDMKTSLTGHPDHRQNSEWYQMGNKNQVSGEGVLCLRGELFCPELLATQSRPQQVVQSQLDCLYMVME